MQANRGRPTATTGTATSPATQRVPIAQASATAAPDFRASNYQAPDYQASDYQASNYQPPNSHSTDSRSPARQAPAAQSPTAQAPSPLRVQVVICLIGGAGLALVVLGSFLPWVISGNVRRSSYQIIGVVGRLGIGDGGALAVLIGAWPFIGVLCVVPVLAAAIRWWRTSGVLAILIGLLSGLLSFGLLILVAGRGGAILRIDPIGPSVMAAGAVLLICAAAAMFAWTNSPVRRLGTRPLANDQR